MIKITMAELQQLKKQYRVREAYLYEIPVGNRQPEGYCIAFVTDHPMGPNRPYKIEE